MSVLVYTENWDGKFKKLSFELVSYASKVAEMLNTTTTVLSLGTVEKSELEKLGNYGADKIINGTSDALKVYDVQAYTQAIAGVVEADGASVVILANNNAGKALAPRLSVKLKAGIGSGVSKLPVSTAPFVVYKRAFSGNAYAKVQINSEKKVLTLAQNSFDLVENNKGAAIENLNISMDAGMVKTEVVDAQKQTGKLLLNDAEIVVSGGRGMKSPDNWGPLEELADLLGAATACSRPVSDEGWRPHGEHTGQTGKIIAPNLYVAIGISGATQHLAGVSSSKYIVAINTDKDAPIFEAAQYGIVGDAQKVLPKLVDAVKESKSK
ncbi:MAG: electron transfer flavoprotein subunit alpha/FixB family protein [Bacteroidales bacterium]|nr:electron transfer flavoprotein subunit alpha/FixB family protein [Bacteroidales bacterium]